MHIAPIRLLAAAAAAAALALTPPAAAEARHQWATINVCDTSRSPDRMGVRGHAPGTGKRERIYMRFQAQFRREGRWRNVPGEGRSPWLYAGSALFRFQETGWTFRFDAPAAGQSFLMRGVASVEWRDRRRRRGRLVWVVTKRARLITEGGHRTVGADPRGFSAATCRIEGA